MFSRLRKKQFAYSVVILAGGAAGGQAVMILVLPLLTRLYSPEDFSVLAVYAGLMTTISLAACLRLDVAIALPEREDEAVNLLALSCIAAGIVSLLTALAIIAWGDVIAQSVKGFAPRTYAWALPLGVFLTATYSALQYWSSRGKAFKRVATTKVCQGLGGAGTMAGCGWFATGALGLILGQVVSAATGALGLAYPVLVRNSKQLKEISVQRMMQQFVRYQRFPKYAAVEVFINSAAVQVPVIIIAALAIGAEAGFLVLAMRVMQGPMSVLGAAISQVYLSNAGESYRKGTLGSTTIDVIGGLVRTGVGPLLFAGICAPDVFGIVFGDDWTRAGELVRWMTPWFVLQFLSSPVSLALQVTDHQKLALVLQTFGLILRAGLVIGAAQFLPERLSEAYAISGAIFYGVYLIVIIHVVSAEGSDLLKQLWKAMLTVSMWCVAGGCVVAILTRI
ncbi:MAG TPA: oligosaccharide flippase family protein [Nitrospira sp.]|nr:oligosaccharide flippase family protein [Nitrospira sp.]HNI67064.1 oligosaccharide flippase family protein [Nitrospira sp.]HNL88206.1 oligosaccharide flippase family protein [Nitrospira sp.]